MLLTRSGEKPMIVKRLAGSYTRLKEVVKMFVRTIDLEKVEMVHCRDGLYLRWADDCWYKAESGYDKLLSQDEAFEMEEKYQEFKK